MITGDNVAITLPLGHFLVFDPGRSMATRLKARFYDLVSGVSQIVDAFFSQKRHNFDRES